MSDRATIPEWLTWSKRESYEKGFESGYSSAAERIIILLEREKPCRLKGTHHDVGLCSCLAIALIKGEQK